MKGRSGFGKTERTRGVDFHVHCSIQSHWLKTPREFEQQEPNIAPDTPARRSKSSWIDRVLRAQL
jgi:hypothetical protein